MRRSTSLWVVMMFGTPGCPGGQPDETGWDAGAQGSDSGSVVADAGEDLVDAGAALTFTVTIEVSEGGSASPQGIVEVESGESVVITLTPDEGFALREVTGTCGGARTDLVYTTAPIESDCALEAFFAAEPTPEPATYCSRIPAARRDLIVCDPEQNFDDWSQGRAYPTNGLRIPRQGALSALYRQRARRQGDHGDHQQHAGAQRQRLEVAWLVLRDTRRRAGRGQHLLPAFSPQPQPVADALEPDRARRQ